MRFFNMMGNAFGCSASGERLVSAARDGDLQEAKALLEYNPRLARYSTFGGRNSPLHFSAAQGHHEIVSLLLESGVDINLRNCRGQTALMQACQFGHWEVVQTLMFFRANIHRTDYLNGGTALHFAALNGHTRCIRLLLADYVPSSLDILKVIQNGDHQAESGSSFNMRGLLRFINKPADGGITALHMAALNGHVEATQLLLDLGASVSEVTIEDGTTIDLIGAGSTALHYAACGGNVQCCQLLIAKGASLTAKNANGWTAAMVARSWHRHWLEGPLTKHPSSRLQICLSPYLSLPLMSIMAISREDGWTKSDPRSPCLDPCVVCLERKCEVSAEGCGHEFCTRCALYLCSTNCASSIRPEPPGSIACPLCRKGIVSFVKLQGTSLIQEPRTGLSLSLCASFPAELDASMSTPLCRPDFNCTSIPPLAADTFRAVGCQKLSLKNLNSICLGARDVNSTSFPCDNREDRMKTQLVCCTGSMLGRSNSHGEGRRSWLSIKQCV